MNLPEGLRLEGGPEGQSRIVDAQEHVWVTIHPAAPGDPDEWRTAIVLAVCSGLAAYTPIEPWCPRCHGEGMITVRGYSIIPSAGVLGPDPQCDHDERCPDCHGTGRLHEFSP